MPKLRSLWLGELPLGEAFWTWAISIGLQVNLMTSVLFPIMITTRSAVGGAAFRVCHFVP